MPIVRQGNYANINWTTRDRELCALVRTVILQHDNTSAQRPLRRSDFFELIPKLHRTLEKRDRYPETRKLMKHILDEDIKAGLRAWRDQSS
ncbi:hypothetical protein D3C81_1747510 [compost metagenome]